MITFYNSIKIIPKQINCITVNCSKLTQNVPKLVKNAQIKKIKESLQEVMQVKDG